MLGKVYRYSQDPDSAIDAYNKGLLLDPNNFDIAKDYGLYLASLGQNQRAAPVLRQAYGLDKSDKQVNDALQQLGVLP